MPTRVHIKATKRKMFWQTRLFAFFTLAPKFRDNGGDSHGGDRAKTFVGLLSCCTAARSTTTRIKYTHTHVYEYINTFVSREEKNIRWYPSLNDLCTQTLRDVSYRVCRRLELYLPYTSTVQTITDYTRGRRARPLGSSTTVEKKKIRNAFNTRDRRLNREKSKMRARDYQWPVLYGSNLSYGQECCQRNRTQYLCIVLMSVIPIRSTVTRNL